MNIHEFQAKELFRTSGITVPSGSVASDAATARHIAETLGGTGWVIKAQVLAGGRAKAGGIKLADSLDEVEQHACEMLGIELKTRQTGESGKKVTRILVEEKCTIAKEFYLAVTIDRSKERIVIIASSEGGVEIEETAHTKPEAIYKEYIDPATGIMPFAIRNIVYHLGFSEKEIAKKASTLVCNLYNFFDTYDCSLAEINPLVVTDEGDVVALDAKLNFDDSALERHPEIDRLRDLSEETPAEKLARENNVNYISLDGNVGCMVNGAGLAMATMDTIKLHGGEPANFLDVGGGASTEMVTHAFKILMNDRKVKSILVNIFGGILKCDLLAEGIVAATREVKPDCPLVVRLEGTNVEKGRETLEQSGLNIISIKTMDEAAAKAVECAG